MQHIGTASFISTMVNARQTRRGLGDQHFSHRSSCRMNSSPEGTAAWVRGLEAFPNLIDPAAPPTPPAKRRRILREINGNSWSCSSQNTQQSYPMSGSPRKQQVRETHAGKDDGTKSIRRSARNDRRAGSTAVLSMRGRRVAPVEDTNTPSRTEELDSTSEYDAVSEVPSFPPPTTSSVKGRSPTRSLSPKKRTVAKREDLALMSPTIEFCAFREAENWGIELPRSVKELWYRCDVHSP